MVAGGEVQTPASADLHDGPMCGLTIPPARIRRPQRGYGRCCRCGLNVAMWRQRYSETQVSVTGFSRAIRARWAEAVAWDQSTIARDGDQSCLHSW